MIAVWHERLSVGDRLIDAEHRRVINLLNEIDVAVRVGAPGAVIEQALRRVVRHIDDHFHADGEHGPPAHSMIRLHARRLLDDWRAGHTGDINRRRLRRLADSWIGHFGRYESHPKADALYGQRETRAATPSRTATSAACCTAPRTSPV